MKKSNVGIKQYYSELGSRKPIAEMEAVFTTSGKFRVKTPLEIKGRGITYFDTFTEDNCNNSSRYGWNVYYVTQNAFKKLSEEYAISQELLLD